MMEINFNVKTYLKTLTLLILFSFSSVTLIHGSESNFVSNSQTRNYWPTEQWNTASSDDYGLN